MKFLNTQTEAIEDLPINAGDDTFTINIDKLLSHSDVNYNAETKIYEVTNLTIDWLKTKIEEFEQKRAFINKLLQEHPNKTLKEILVGTTWQKQYDDKEIVVITDVDENYIHYIVDGWLTGSTSIRKFLNIYQQINS